MSKLRTDLSIGETGHATIHNDERARINAFCVVPAPVGTAAQNAAAIAAAIESVTDASDRMGTVTLGPGVWNLAGAVGIDLRNKFGGVLQGVGAATVLRWAGDSDGVIVRIAHCQQTTLRNLSITTASAAGCAVHLTRDNALSPNHAPTKNVIERVRLDGGYHRHLQDGIRVSGLDANNDFHVFEQVYISGYTRAGFYLGGSQSYNNVMRDCHVWGPAECGVLQVFIGVNSATFQWDGGSTFSHSVADFSLIRNAYAPVRISHVNSEGSECFIRVRSSTLATLIAEGNRWSGAASTNHVALDFEGLVLATVHHNHFGDGLNPTPANTIRYVPAPLSHMRFEGNIVFSTAESVFTDSVPEALVGNIKANEVTLDMGALTQ